MAASYPVSMTLRYRVGALWLEEQTLAGEVVQSEHEFVLEFDRLEANLRERALGLAKRLDFGAATPQHPFVRVIGSGLEPQHVVIRDEQRFSPCASLAGKLGRLAELPRPTDDPTQLIEAYETWVSRYLDMSTGALLGWIKRTAPEGDFDADSVPAFESRDYWEQSVQYLRPGGRTAARIDGRDEPELFQRARGAQQLRDFAEKTADEEDVRLAQEIVGAWPTTSFPLPATALVEAFEAHSRRLAELALARYWTRQRQKAGFELEMLRWVAAHGSERLKLGVDDGYRMMPVYLNERIAREAPGFYAHLPKAGEPKLWQPRTGPSEEALLLRRAVQRRMSSNQLHGEQPPKVEIGWMKAPPDAMYDLQRRTGWDDDGDPFLYDDPFEVIVVPDWLGRYALLAAVWTPDEEQPPGYIKRNHVLVPSEYELPDLAAPPLGGDTIGEGIELSTFKPRDDDIPF